MLSTVPSQRPRQGALTSVPAPTLPRSSDGGVLATEAAFRPCLRATGEPHPRMWKWNGGQYGAVSVNRTPPQVLLGGENWVTYFVTFPLAKLWEQRTADDVGARPKGEPGSIADVRTPGEAASSSTF